ncbi:hypothetical protein [Phormidesmis priestleyi]|nr:hypothetical protein [Phormidesmis priestleyi]
MYGTRSSPIKTMLISFLVGWMFGTFFNVIPKSSLPWEQSQPTNTRRG